MPHSTTSRGWTISTSTGGGDYSLPPVSLCLSTGVRIDAESETLLPINGGGFDVAHALRGEGFDASEDGTGRGTPIVPVAIQERAISENPDAGPDGVGVRQDGAAYTLEARQVPQAVAFSAKDHGGDAMEDCRPTLRAGGFTDSHQNGGIMPAVAFDMRGRDGGAQLEGPHDTANIRAADGGSSRSYIAEPWAVRRLTPVECERLQGFPDNFTKIPGAAKGGWRQVDETEDVEELRAFGMPLKLKGNLWFVKDPDGPRYKALGNSWAVNCAEWIGERMTIVEAWSEA